MQEGVRLKYVYCVRCVLCYVISYVIKILGKKEMVTLNN